MAGRCDISVIPAKAGTQTRGDAPVPERSSLWVPAFAGMTLVEGCLDG
jgi:hypothetical protein